MAAGAVCLKKPHHIVILRFSEVVKGHANKFKAFTVGKHKNYPFDTMTHSHTYIFDKSTHANM